VFAYDYPLLSILATVVWLCFWIAIFVAVIWAFIDNFRRHDHHGGAKAGWCALILLLPLIGTLIYVIARPADPYEVAVG
jgi:hypothetical protein